MITIKTDTILQNFDGTPLKHGGNDLTVATAFSTVLGSKVSNPTLGWVLGKKFACDSEVDLTAEEVVFLKDAMTNNDLWLAVVTGQCLEILEAKQ